jgi:O-succinylbenzoic acid--CoA ligase
MIDWQSDQSHVFLNPRLPESERDRLEDVMRKAPSLPGHLWLATSGSSGSVKMVALSKQAMLASAASVNRHIRARPNQNWLRVLPIFHVGGLAIHARAALAGARVEVDGWDPRGFVSRTANEQIAFSSLVPAQVYDLIAARLPAPATLRAIIVGGGALPAEHYDAARALGWPVLPSYGMTEACSQVATAEFDGPDLRLLPHLDGRVEDDGRLAFRGPSLLTGYATETGFVDPKQDGWFISEDVGTIESDRLTVSGRSADFVKIGGESVDLGRLDRILAEVVRELGSTDAALAALPDQRLGFVIHMASTGDAEGIAEAFNGRVMPFERIRATHRVAAIPRTSLGKLERAALAALCQR